jgi:hypothetical protein
MNEVEPIDPDLARLLDAERTIDAPATAVRGRMLARLEGVLPPLGPGGGGHGPGGGGGAPTATHAARAAASTTFGKAIGSIALVAVGAVAGAGAHAAATSTSLVSHPAAMIASPQRIVVSVTLPERAPETLPTPSAAASAVASTPDRAAAESPARSEKELTKERLLLEAARTALGRKDTESALAAVERHGREFPRGQLSEERDVLRVQILRVAGNDADARERAAAFKKRFPKSMMQDAVDQAGAAGKKR